MTPLPPALRPGTGVIIELSSELGTRQYRSRVEVVSEGQVTVATPSDRGHLVSIDAGEYLTLSVMTPTGQLFVEGEVTGQSTAGLPMLHVRPVSIETERQRSYQRVQTHIAPAGVWVWQGAGEPDPGLNPASGGAAGEGWQPVQATIVDISGGGVGLLTDVDLPLQSLLHLQFPLLSGEDQLSVRGHVAISRPRPGQQQQRYQIGVKFANLSRADQERLVRANHLFQIEQRRRTLGYDR